MNTTLTRRGFIAGLTAVAATRARCFGEAPGGARYSVAVLGDTHYDAEPESVYHSHYDESNKWAKIQHAEFRRNGEMWRERCRRLVEASATVASRLDTRFILQMGDLVQGDCDDVPTHVKMLEDAIGVMREPFARRNAARPFLTVIGNHDFRGKGARDAYLDFSRRFMGAEMLRLTGEECAAEYPVFSFRLGGDLWVFCDFERSDLQPVIDAVEGATARHVFLVTHGPFTAADSNSFRWRLGGSRKCDALRPRLYEALSRRHGPYAHDDVLPSRKRLWRLLRIYGKLRVGKAGARDRRCRLFDRGGIRSAAPRAALRRKTRGLQGLAGVLPPRAQGIFLQRRRRALQARRRGRLCADVVLPGRRAFPRLVGRNVRQGMMNVIWRTFR